MVFVSNLSAASIPDTLYCGSKTDNFDLSLSMFNDDTLEEITSTVYGDALDEGIISKIDGNYVITFNVNEVGNSTVVISDNSGLQFFRNIEVIEVTTLKVTKSSENTFTLVANGFTDLVGNVTWQLNGTSVDSNNVVSSSSNEIVATYSGLSATYSDFDFGTYGDLIINIAGVIILLFLLFLFIRSLISTNIFKRMKKDTVTNHKLILETIEKIDKISKKFPKEIAKGIIVALTLNNNAALIKSNSPDNSAKLVGYTNSVVHLYDALNELFDNLSNENIINILNYIDTFNEKIVFELDKIEASQKKIHDDKKIQDSKDKKLKSEKKKNKQVKSKNQIKEVKTAEEKEALVYLKSLNILK